MKRWLAAGCVVAALISAHAANAHTAWFVRQGGANIWLLRFGGHEGKLEPVVPGKLKWIHAYDTNGKPMEVRRSVKGNEVRALLAQEPAVITLHYDNGVHTRTATPGPTIEKPMDQVPGAVAATAAVKYGKTIVQWTPAVVRYAGQPFEIVPLSPAQPVAGQPMQVRVLRDGRPVAGVSVGRGEDTAAAKTDAKGVATFVPTRGSNKLWAGERIAQTGNPRFTELSYEYLLTFKAI